MESNFQQCPKAMKAIDAHIHTGTGMWWDIVTLVGHCMSTFTNDLCY